MLAVFSSRRLSVGWAMALGMTVESTMTRSTLAESMTATRRATSIVCCSSSSTPPSPMHFLQAGQARRIQRQLRLQVGVDAEVLPVRVLDPRLGDGFVGGRKNVCCRYSRPATSRGRNAGRPTPDVKWAAKPDLICDQSMSDARRTSGWRMSIARRVASETTRLSAATPASDTWSTSSSLQGNNRLAVSALKIRCQRHRKSEAGSMAYVMFSSDSVGFFTPPWS